MSILETYVEVQVLQGGHFTLPEKLFVHPSSSSARCTVPSLSFLITHVDRATRHKTRLIFDLGLRHPIESYPLPIQQHVSTRQPVTTEPDVIQSLEAGGLAPADIDYVILSHLHWDHIGNPRAFDRSTFIVGPGALSLLDREHGALPGSHSFFESDLLPRERTIELPESTAVAGEDYSVEPAPTSPDWKQNWKVRGRLPRTMDIFGDGSLLVVDVPGHLPGHINLLARTGPGALVYLAGDTCHDRRILNGERDIAEWLDDAGRICCIHTNKQQARQTIALVRKLEADGVEVIFSHDVKWESRPENRRRFLGAADSSIS
ncbi:Cytochrome P450 monooxygenase andK [Penicillium rolfsii]|nr:Cytochrome P450 monooxygenase andK [Penicillium rolfsii]